MIHKICFLLLFALPSFALKFEKVVEGLVLPWGMAFLNENEILITEKLGEIKVIDVKTKKVILVKGKLESKDHGQGGLLDVALDPDFTKNQLVFFTYTKEIDDNYTTALASAKLIKNSTGDYELKDIKELFVAEPAVDDSIHFGSRLVVLKDEIFMTVGDRNQRKIVQQLSNHLGKVLRLDKSGKAKSDNPFIGKSGAKPEVWSSGHRNPQGLVWREDVKELWLGEHGPRGGDEINLVKKGANYGWPMVTFGREYSGFKITDETSRPGIESPTHYYVPSIAPCGMIYYSADKFPELKDSFLIGSLVLTHLNQVKIVDKKFVFEKRYFENKSLRIRDVEASPAGEVYFITDSGHLYQLKNSP
ncbi:MAG: PQQ-dependent sugar dehydrogenase [Bdellovibrionales bacterium]